MQTSIEIYDQFLTVKDENDTIVHSSSSAKLKRGIFKNIEEAKEAVKIIYEETKLLGNYEDIIVNFDELYVELLINFADGRNLNRVIYAINHHALN
jgi:hypothetical protein